MNDVQGTLRIFGVLIDVVLIAFYGVDDLLSVRGQLRCVDTLLFKLFNHWYYFLENADWAIWERLRGFPASQLRLVFMGGFFSGDNDFIGRSVNNVWLLLVHVLVLLSSCAQHIGS